jgi:hypothetical protein
LPSECQHKGIPVDAIWIDGSVFHDRPIAEGSDLARPMRARYAKTRPPSRPVPGVNLPLARAVGGFFRYYKELSDTLTPAASRGRMSAGKTGRRYAGRRLAVEVGFAVYCALRPGSACIRVTGGGFHLPVSASDLGAWSHISKLNLPFGAGRLDEYLSNKKAANGGGLNHCICKVNQQRAHQQPPRPQTLVW